MPYRVFNRSAAPDHPFQPDLELWFSGSFPDVHRAAEYRAMASNVVHDHRVTPERESELLHYFAEASGTRAGERLEVAVRKYFDKEIQGRARPAFLTRQSNGLNLVPDIASRFSSRRSAAGRRGAVPQRDLWLGRVLDLNGLVPVFSFARSRGVAEFRRFPRIPKRGSSGRESYPKTVLDWLDRQLDQPGRQRTFVASALEAIESKRLTKPYQPTWATFWSHFERHVDGGAARWAAVVGLPNARACARWVIVLKYRLREAGRLVRPTLLDTNFNPYHFPSPPQAELVKGGHPVDLQFSPPATRLMPEFIHQQIPHPRQHWENAGFLIERIELPPAGLLAERRSQHCALLHKVYGAAVSAWMQRCM